MGTVVATTNVGCLIVLLIKNREDIYGQMHTDRPYYVTITSQTEMISFGPWGDRETAIGFYEKTVEKCSMAWITAQYQATASAKNG